MSDHQEQFPTATAGLTVKDFRHAALGNFLAAPPPPDATGVMTLEENLAGTRALADRIDAAAKDAASRGRTDLPDAVAAVTDALLAADITGVVVTIQGPLRLSDYLVTRCVEAVVQLRRAPGP